MSVRISLWAWAVCVWCLAGSVGRAEIVWSRFDESTLLNNLNSNQSFEGLNETPSQFRSGAVTFNNDGVYFGGSSWSGFGYSQRLTAGVNQNLWDSSNDLVTRPGGGPAGSTTWGVVGGGGIMTADAGYRFATVDLTSTLYTWTSIAMGDPFAGPPMGNGGGTGRFAGQDDFFTVRFTNTATSNFLDFNLADFRGNTDTVVTSWQTFNLLSLDAAQLSISFLGSRETNYVPPPDPPVYFMDTPAYVAMDNIGVVNVSVVPEPSSMLLLGSSVAALAYTRRRPWSAIAQL